jgi:hypothetical protein
LTTRMVATCSTLTTAEVTELTSKRRYGLRTVSHTTV